MPSAPGKRSGTKLTIQACSLDSNGSPTADGAKFEAVINPESYKREHGINYNKDTAEGKLAPELKFSHYNEEKISFDFVIDGTGVADAVNMIRSPKEVKAQIKALKDIAYTYDGSMHQPKPVKLSWGPMSFWGRLTSMSVNYTLFKSDGSPLRAKVSLSFSEYVSPVEESKRAARSSPDLSHTRVVKAGDTLPLLCHEIYRDSSLYTYIARENNLTDFRNIPSGTRLSFPPIQALDIP
jgi:hypothetical protein